MAIDNVALFDQAEAVLEHLLALGGKARDNVRANRCFGARRLDPLDKSDCLFAAVAPLHPLEDHVVARLQREVQVRHDSFMLGDEREHAIVDLDRIEGGEAEARQVRNLVQYAFDQKAERRLAGKIGAIASEINAGPPDFPISTEEHPSEL